MGQMWVLFYVLTDVDQFVESGKVPENLVVLLSKRMRIEHCFSVSVMSVT